LSGESVSHVVNILLADRVLKAWQSVLYP